jgi:CheY-like chemotaxis protein
MSEPYPILLVEDDENDVFFFRRAARDSQIANPIFVARDGQDAIEYLHGEGRYENRVQFPLPCLMILDLKMPRKTGMDVLEWLRAHPMVRTLPVIVLSSSAQPEDIERALHLGANAFVVKPGSIDTRAELTRSIRSFWIQFNRPPAFCCGNGAELARA